ncbi:MAG: protoheme IX farnesyltransferase [Ignavibacteriae bacterium]|jgi:heme o synthase|nr:protoheme IX farnesyltransferase [Ignavibacteriota bacterium]
MSVILSSTNQIRKSNEIENPKGFLQFLLLHKNILLELTKFRITFFVSVTTIVGFIFYNGQINYDLFIVSLGVIFLAAGASALNEYQERNLDGKMQRTISRPIPSGRISSRYALIATSLLIIIGSFILSLVNVTVLLLGLFTLIWYNAVYTPLKNISPFAIIPGSLVGSLPPMIGWAAAGGNLFDVRILSLSGFLFIWQIPHFWLLVLMYDDQYKKAGFPTLSNIFSHSQIENITYLLMVVLVFSSFIFPVLENSYSIFTIFLFIVFGFLSIFFTFSKSKDKQNNIFRNKFVIINLYVLSILLLITAETLI